MATRSNACSELVRFWLQARHGCLVDEGIPVPVPYALSDIDLVAYQPREEVIVLPGGVTAGPRLIVETKDEHDWDASGREFAGLLRGDVAKMGDEPWIPRGTRAVKFTMLRQEHFERATALFGVEQSFDRLFVLHALDQVTRDELGPTLLSRRIHVLTIREVVADVLDWYAIHKRPSGLRQTLVGDMLHLLVGFCGLRMQ